MVNLLMSTKNDFIRRECHEQLTESTWSELEKSLYRSCNNPIAVNETLTGTYPLFLPCQSQGRLRLQLGGHR